MKRFELTPTDGRKSFNSKCHVEETERDATLYSYETEIAKYIFSTGELIKTESWNYGPTTKRHQKAFLQYYGIKEN